MLGIQRNSGDVGILTNGGFCELVFHANFLLQLNFQGDRVRDYGSQSGFKPSLFPSLSPK